MQPIQEHPTEMIPPDPSRAMIDPQALMQQMTWIKQVMDEDGLIVVPSHDDRLLTRYAAEGLLGTSLEL